MEQGTTLHVGLDVHARTIDVLVHGSGTKNREEWRLENEPRAVTALARRLRREDGDVVVCYEAGPTGFALQRQLQAKGLECRVIAPSARLRPGWALPSSDREFDLVLVLPLLPIHTDVPVHVDSQSSR